jgi:hypothetical protein
MIGENLAETRLRKKPRVLQMQTSARYTRGMHALVRGAVGAAAFSALAALAPELGPGTTALPPELPRSAAVCPSHAVPDGRGCVPVPALARATATDARDLIVRQPERPESLARYAPLLGSVQPRLEGSALAYDGARGQTVRLVALEGQAGGAEIRFAGDLDGGTVITLHVVGEGDRARRYLVLHTGLDAIAPTLLAGARPAEGERLGTAGASFRMEFRQLRASADLERIAPKKLATSAVSVTTDPRNVLRLAPTP